MLFLLRFFNPPSEIYIVVHIFMYFYTDYNRFRNRQSYFYILKLLATYILSNYYKINLWYIIIIYKVVTFYLWCRKIIKNNLKKDLKCPILI